jgi:hypothetical protein
LGCVRSFVDLLLALIVPTRAPQPGSHLRPLTTRRFERLNEKSVAMPLVERLAYARFDDAVANQKWAIDNERGPFLRTVRFIGLPRLTDQEARLLLQDIVHLCQASVTQASQMAEGSNRRHPIDVPSLGIW